MRSAYRGVVDLSSLRRARGAVAAELPPAVTLNRSASALPLKEPPVRTSRSRLCRAVSAASSKSWPRLRQFVFDCFRFGAIALGTCATRSRGVHQPSKVVGLKNERTRGEGGPQFRRKFTDRAEPASLEARSRERTRQATRHALRAHHTPGKRSVSLSPPSAGELLHELWLEPLAFRPEPVAPPAALATRGSQPAAGCGYRSRYIA